MDDGVGVLVVVVSVERDADTAKVRHAVPLAVTPAAADYAHSPPAWSWPLYGSLARQRQSSVTRPRARRLGVMRTRGPGVPRLCRRQVNTGSSVAVDS